MTASNSPGAAGRLELWAGAECTVNRVGDRTFDQTRRTGHQHRIDDLDRLAELGIETLRYPLLWERACSELGADPDWSWTDARMERCRALGLKPIAGLVHHGSGPKGTSLIEDTFATGLAEYAGRVAERYPWIDAYTPVNEPRTTARFSGLYGHWYPHGTDERTFARALVNQCAGIVLAMRAIRRTNPAARLVQTDDLGETHSTPLLEYHRDFENARRWLSWDLLCGRVDRAHPLREYLLDAGIPPDTLAWFLDNPCPPGIVGINYYLTSERYLDERLDRYPPDTHGGNGRQRYADVEAVRVLDAGPQGLPELLRRVWNRNGLPLAVTEAHLGCTREEQVRWLAGVWTATTGVRAEGIDVRAVTAWSAFGTFDWDSLVTRDRGHYEPGLFDIRSARPRPTAIAGIARQLAAGRTPEHPVLDGCGWWERPERLYGALSAAGPRPDFGHPVLIVGANTALRRACLRACAVRGLPTVVRSKRDFAAADAAAVRAHLDVLRPWAVIDTGGSSCVETAQSQSRLCRREGVAIPESLARICAERGLPFAFFSTEHVFDGRSETPYREGDTTAPVNVFGCVRAEAEAAVAGVHPSALIVRTGTLFGSRSRADFVWRAVSALRADGEFSAPDDLIGTPCYAPDAVREFLDLLVDGEIGVRHLATPEPLSWAELARRAARLAGLDPGRVEGRPSTGFGFKAPRGSYTALTSRRLGALPELESGLRHFLTESLRSA